MTAPHLREYWLVRGPGEYQSLPIESRKAARTACTRYRKFYSAAFRVVHVTVYPKGQRAAWERVVRATMRWAAGWNGHTIGPGALDQALLDEVSALGSHRPVAK